MHAWSPTRINKYRPHSFFFSLPPPPFLTDADTNDMRTPYMCSYTPISVLIYVSLHYYACVLILHIQLPYTTIHVSSYYYIYVDMWAASQDTHPSLV